MYLKRITTSLGTFTLKSDGKALIYCKIDDGSENENSCALLEEAAQAIGAYLSGSKTSLEAIPVNPSGTEFQLAVLQCLRQVPYGKTLTYLDIARMLHKERACRAVGRACAKNPIWLFIPCHRIIGVKGALTGYAGGIEMKRTLLTLEGVMP